MYDEYIMTFICVSECGSLLKAAEKLYLSPNAIKKRIDRLEGRTKLHLFYAHLKEWCLPLREEAFTLTASILRKRCALRRNAQEIFK